MVKRVDENGRHTTYKDEIPIWRWKHADKDWECYIFMAVEFPMFNGSRTKQEWFPQAGMVPMKPAWFVSS
jgi:hypothetical protein